jgi:hypothetical protein
LILPVRLRLVASGLMIEKVRWIAMRLAFVAAGRGGPEEVARLLSRAAGLEKPLPERQRARVTGHSFCIRDPFGNRPEVKGPARHHDGRS